MGLGYPSLHSIVRFDFPLALVFKDACSSFILLLILWIQRIENIQLLKFLSLLLHGRLNKCDYDMRPGCGIARTWIWIIGIIYRG